MSKGKPEPRPLTRRQRRIYDYLRRYLKHNGYPPTVREIGDYFMIASPNGVAGHLAALEKKGWIKRKTKGASRAIKLLGGR